MKRYNFYIYTGITVVLLGLLIFFSASSGVRFFHAGIFNGISPLVHTLNNMRLWRYASGAGTGIEQEKKLAAALGTIEVLTQENSRLRSALDFKDKNNIHLQAAAILYYGQELGKEYLLIDRGAKDAIQKGDMVVDADGLLVGTIQDIQDSFAKVGIAANADDVVAAQLLPSNVKAFAKGLGNRTFSLELLPQSAIIRTGDYVMAQGNNASFLLAEVVRADISGAGIFKEVRAVLLAHPEIEKEVYIVSGK